MSNKDQELEARPNSPCSKENFIKRKKELTPNSKAPRKKLKTEEDDVEASTSKLGLMQVSPAEAAVVFPSLEDNDQEWSVRDSDKLNDKGEWSYAEDSEKLPLEDLDILLDDIRSLIVETVNTKLEPVIPEKVEDAWFCPENACPIRADVRTFDFKQFGAFVKEVRGRKFDVIMMDPPWRLTTANPTRGVCISYDCLADNELLNMPMEELQTDGFLLIWIINSKMSLAIDMFDKWGYVVKDTIDWAKMTVNRRIASGHCYYL
jgi:hypothetical protein